jgi:hypothetical protein
MPSSPTAPRTGHRLALEWSRLRTRPAAIAHAETWRLVDGALHDLDQVLRVIGFEVEPTDATETNLRRLVELAATDELAARVVVQRLLPGIAAVTRRRLTGGAPPSAYDELLGAAWIAIRTFNPARRPRCLAAALLSDADHLAFRRAARRRSASELPVDPQTSTALVDPTPDPHPALELADLFAAARAAGVPDADLDLLRGLLRAPRAIDLAADLSVTPRTIRNRRDRVAARLREVVLAA